MSFYASLCPLLLSLSRHSLRLWDLSWSIHRWWLAHESCNAMKRHETPCNAMQRCFRSTICKSNLESYTILDYWRHFRKEKQQVTFQWNWSIQSFDRAPCRDWQIRFRIRLSMKPSRQEGWRHRIVPTGVHGVECDMSKDQGLMIRMIWNLSWKMLNV